MNEKSDENSTIESLDGSDLVDSPENEIEKDSFTLELEKTLTGVEKEVAILETETLDQQAWQQAREIIYNFKPVPGFIWRLCHYVLGRSGNINKLDMGLVYGLRRLLFAAASDKILGAGRKIDDVREAINTVPSDVIAAVSTIHAICRRLSKCDFDRIWRPILDDALLRARIGFVVGELIPEFGSGRGMLAGFAGRMGLAVLISSGKLEQAQRCLELLAAGEGIQVVGRKVYKCDPLQISAMTLTAIGCSRDAAFGTVSFASRNPLKIVQNDEQMRWLAAFTITEKVRVGLESEILPELWEALGFGDPEDQAALVEEAKMLIRRGHGWNWIV
ncbi:MAG: hypothetical protein R3A13_00995 [Bdellovibrionota bacterium]